MKHKIASAVFVAASLTAASAFAMMMPGSTSSVGITTYGSGDGSFVASDFVLGPTTPGKWGPAALGTPAIVTYSYMADGVSCAAEVWWCTITSISTGMGTIGVTAIDAAFASWSAAVSGLTFVLVADDGAPFDAATTSGNIRVGMHAFDGASGVLAHAFFPPANGLTAAGDMHFDIGDCWESAFDGTADGCFDIGQVAKHEIGHSIGLRHTAVPGSLMNPYYTEAFVGLQADDIAGGCFIYGCSPVAVPEPGTLFLAGLGLLGMMGLRRSRKSA